MICILHGYLLDGSGSNLWSRSILEAMCRQGYEVHIMCQENHPNLYPFIKKALSYDLDGKVRTLFEREIPYKGGCILHQPKLSGILPVYVWDKYEEYSDVRPMVEMTDAELDIYLQRNIEVLSQIVEQYDIRVVHANHLVLMSVVAAAVYESHKIPYTIMPHGSALEYAVKKDRRFLMYAQRALAKARLVFVNGEEIQERVEKTFSEVKSLSNKFRTLNLGVDTEIFDIIPANHENKGKAFLDPILKEKRIKSLCDGLSQQPCNGGHIGKGFLTGISLPINFQAKLTQEYNQKVPDQDLIAKLQAVEWTSAQVILYVGRLIYGKGVHTIVGSLPDVMDMHSNAILVVVGHGPARGLLELLLWAAGNGNGDLFKQLVNHGRGLEDGSKGSLETLAEWIVRLESLNEWDSWIDKAQRSRVHEKVVFTGYLTHEYLRWLFPCCDCAVFPSVVKESGPLVFLESIASGCFPLGTNIGGIKASIDSFSAVIPDEVGKLMQIQPDRSVGSMIENLTELLKSGHRWQFPLREELLKSYDWKSIADRLVHHVSVDFDVGFDQVKK